MRTTTVTPGTVIIPFRRARAAAFDSHAKCTRARRALASRAEPPSRQSVESCAPVRAVDGCYHRSSTVAARFFTEVTVQTRRPALLECDASEEVHVPARVLRDGELGGAAGGGAARRLHAGAVQPHLEPGVLGREVHQLEQVV